MTKNEIIDLIARERRVEQMIQNICKTTSPEMDDLAQMVYLALLTKAEETITGFYQRGELNFLLVRIIKNQWFSNDSPFAYTFKKYKAKAKDITEQIDRYEQRYTECYGSLEDVFGN